MSRIDRLQQNPQLVLKIASIFGQEFLDADLMSVLPPELYKALGGTNVELTETLRKVKKKNPQKKKYKKIGYSKNRKAGGKPLTHATPQFVYEFPFSLTTTKTHKQLVE